MKSRKKIRSDFKKIKEAASERSMKKKSFWTGLVLIAFAAVFLEAISLLQAHYAKKGVRNEAIARAESQLNSTRNNILNIVNQVESAVRNTVWVAQWCLDVPDSLQNIPKLIVNNNPIVAGSTIALVPGYYKDRPLFAPYSAITNGEIMDKTLATPEYDYPSKEWFTKPIEKEKDYWSEPYIDTGGGEILMTTYSVPIRDKTGRIAAVLTADLDLEWLSTLVEGLKIYPSAFSTVVSRTGQIMVSPAETLVMKTSINEFASSVKDSNDLKKLNAAMLNRESGNMLITHEGEKNMVLFGPIDRTGWAINVFIPEKEIFANLDKLSSFIRILQLLGLVLLFLIMRAVANSQIRFKAINDRKEKMENELHIASRIQMSMIPKIFPPFPTRKDIDMAADIVPAKEVGGDLYDFFIRDEKLFFCIGDVSGKGVPASMVMAVTRSLFRSVSTREDNPADIVSSINDSMSDMNESNMFVTFFCGVLNLSDGTLKYCNAGHNAPLILTDRIECLNVVPNLPIGVLKGMGYQQQETSLKYDDAIFLYTDGITEAENLKHEQFGLTRLKNTLSGRKASIEHLKNVQTAVSKFVDGAPQSDDMTMLFIHYLNTNIMVAGGTPEANNGLNDNSDSSYSLRITNDIQQIRKLSELIDKIAEENKISNQLHSSINLAVEEAVTNVICYAYGEKKNMPIDINVFVREGEIKFDIEDSGKPFDPTAAPKANTASDADQRQVGGLGIHLFKNIMDSVNYSYRDGKNILSLTKRFI